MSDLETRCLAKSWFYPFELPSGGIVPSYHGGELDAIHHTRTTMMQDAIASAFGTPLPANLEAIDLASHQGWFSAKLHELGFARVIGVDARDEHVADARLMAETLGHSRTTFRQSDVHALRADDIGTFDLVLCFGLIYHLEDPIGALRVARALCRGTCLIETQVAPGQTGWLDYGSHRFVRPIQGSFAIIDETDDTHGPETSTLGICLVPSLDALVWILRKVGFSRVEVLPVPADGYEQLVHHKRVMIAAHI